MILIGIAWLLVLAIALYQSIHGLFSAVIMAFLTTICAVVALGCYEWLGPAYLYWNQPAYADALSLVLHFVLPLLLLRIGFDKLITGNAPIGSWADRAAGGAVGLYIGMVMVGILTIALQMLPYGASVMGYKPFDSSLQRSSRIYCDEFALGLFNSAAGLASDRSYKKVHDDLLLELFCGRNTAGKHGRVDAIGKALKISGVYKPSERKWKTVDNSDDLPKDPLRADGKSDVLIVHTQVSKSARNADDNWYRLPATHFRLVTRSGASLYPVGYMTMDVDTDKWKLHAAKKSADDKAKVADLCVLRRLGGEKRQDVLWVYRQPKSDTGEDLADTDAGDRAKRKRAAKHEPEYMVFRRTIKVSVPPATKAMPKDPADKKKAETEAKKEDSKKTVKKTPKKTVKKTPKKTAKKTPKKTSRKTARTKPKSDT